MAFATIGAMPRALLAFGLAVGLAGCGKVTFGPLDGGGDQPDTLPEPPDAGTPDRGGFPDADPPDFGPVECEIATAQPIGEGDWPFKARTETERRVVYERVFYNEAAGVGIAGKGCNAPACHGYPPEENAMSSPPLIPIDGTVLAMHYGRAIDEVWERMRESGEDPASGGRMWAHHADYGTPAGKTAEIWRPGGQNGDKIEFLQRVIRAAGECHTWGWIKSYETRICEETGSPDAGAGGADAGELDGGAAPDGGGQQQDCFCEAPFTAAAMSLTMSPGDLEMNCHPD